MPNLDVVTFLTDASLDNYNNYCLGYTFSARDFNDGTLGLAWVGSTTSLGGICEKNATVLGVTKSLNSGIVTIVNYASRVPQLVTQLTFSHEIGHSFGSPHDTDGSTCAPGGTNGNYIMYSHATSGSQSNNFKYSTCSLSNMTSVLVNRISASNFCFEGNFLK